MNVPIFGLIDTIVDKIFPDKEEAAKRKAELFAMQKNGELKELEEATKVIVAEANSSSWIARNWRPLTMLSFVVIIVNNYILYPYISLFWTDAPMLEIPPHMWELLKIGIGGYVVGRSVEKAVDSWKDKKTNGS